MTDPYLIFIDAEDDAAMYPLSRMVALTVAGDGALLMQFESSIGGTGSATSAIDTVTLTITANQELVVFKALAELFEGAKRNMKNKGFLVICDDINSVFAHADILSCAIGLDT